MKISPLPPLPKLRVDSEYLGLISEIDRKLAKIDGCCLLDSNGLFTELLNIREAAFSIDMDYPEKSPIEFDSYFLNLAESKDKIDRYNKSLLLGQKLLKDVSSVSHIIKSIHKELFEIENAGAGLFRKRQVWIRDSAKEKNNSVYIAPDDEEIIPLMNDLEVYLAMDISYPAVINAALIHAQFEMIHPFESRNGLVGRILIHLHFLWKKRLANSVLQISKALNKHKLEYFDRLEDLEKNNNWNGWIKFFLRMIDESATETLWLFNKIHQQKEKDLNLIIEKDFASTASICMLNFITRNPVFTISQITEKLGYTKQTINLLIKRFVDEKLIEEISGKKRYRTYTYKTIYDVLTQGQ